jgi:prepilin-type N-terminal cleavage/methylation domain-containing protein
MRRNERGMTLVEVLVSLAIVAVIIAFTTSMVSTVLRGTQDNINKQFATQKAVSMLEELRALIQTQSGTTTIVLDDYDDGTVNRTLLTTQRTITDPADPASGNTRSGGQWLYERRVTVQRVRGANDLRIVNVKVFVRETAGPRLLAEVAGVLSTIGQNMPPTQVYDVYLIAVENVPGWWLYMDNVVPFVENAMQDLESRHPGLQFRKHWISKLSYGRDQLYQPYVNKEEDSTNQIDKVYFYPGKMPDDSPVEKYYPFDALKGRMWLDADAVNTDDATSYSFADQYNHSMRYEDELALFNARVSAGLETKDAFTLRLLLDDMAMHPSRYMNAIVINLHGELFPFPPVRNYSDAAKDPEDFPYQRAVTHPTRIAYANTDPLTLRVYSYHNNVANPSGVPDKMHVPITVTIKDLNWTPAPGDIVAINGGIDLDGDGTTDSYSRINAGTSSTTTAMWFDPDIVGSDTVIKLYNSPLKSPCYPNANCSSSGGLRSTRRLYALDYIPSPVEDLPDVFVPTPFSVDLATQGDVVKNTARWIITIPTAQLANNKTYTIETRIDDDLTSGTLDNKVSNLSRTYAWRGTDVWKYGDATNDAHMPLTERYQILGDPRHCPYADLKLPHAGSGRTNADPLGMGYNRYFDDFHNSSSNALGTWPGWSYRAPIGGTPYGIKNNSSDSTAGNDGWDTGGSYLEIDMPRIFQMLRSSIVRTHSIYTTMTGFSYFYVGIGGEIGYDSSNGFPDSIPVSSRPFTGSNGTRYEQSITDATIDSNVGGVKYIRENNSGSDYWWSMNWLGELAPDSAWGQWSSTGNLNTGTGTGTFSRVLRSSINTRLPSGTSLINSVRRTAEEGSTAFFWSGGTASTFHHRYEDDTSGNLQAPDGTAIASTYKLPLATSMPNSRPFAINVNDTDMNPDHFLQQPYGAATTLGSLAEFYRHSTGVHGSALLSMRSGSDVAFVAVNGLSPAGESGVAFISRWSFLSLIQSFLAGGLYSTAGVYDPSRVRELPRVVITNPNDNVDLDNPSTVAVSWNGQWRRWDGLPYTPSYPNDFDQDDAGTTVRYTPLYSRDNGRTWLQMLDDTAATPGTRPANTYLQTTATYTWSTPAASFPKGNYLIRIEAYRDEVPLHYAFHQYRAFIKR